jgi:hypothetical protein
MRRWYEKTGLVSWVCVALLMACGPGWVEEPIGEGSRESPDSTCLNCNQDDEEEEEQDLTHVAAVLVYPEELMFFGDFQTTVEIEGSVSVKNQTNSAVWITAVYVGSDTTIYGVDSRDYFKTDWDSDTDNLLMPGEALEITVRFQASHELRSGGLFIETTHVDFGLLNVDLLGKLFGDN